MPNVYRFVTFRAEITVRIPTEGTEEENAYDTYEKFREQVLKIEDPAQPHVWEMRRLNPPRAHDYPR
jgi:hypothetical protein